MFVCFHIASHFELKADPSTAVLALSEPEDFVAPSNDEESFVNVNAKRWARYRANSARMNFRAKKIEA